ncbi:2'-5' RNA ligase family protein [Clostridium bornimense]|uniref:2'-5' RNA ligase family protein n=1 Tax=Clostridium bornimense TaxID=1216932 RepID=UPI001C128451|nr:2'-5' RNA ligase family protein [Clostridium bornimense]MBU5315685.1 2'-5' RNA ligase family protein [Clostridium bornimense]
MKYNLVALFDNDSNKLIDFNYRHISKRNKNIHHIPLHIVLETIDDPDINKLNDLISKILRPYKKFKVHLDTIYTLSSNNRNQYIGVEERGYINGLVRNLNEDLKLSGFKVKDIESTEELFIPLSQNLSKNFSSKSNLSQTSIDSFAKIEKVELWKIVGNKKYSVVHTYNLREF